MSYSVNKKCVLNDLLPINQRMSRIRSCAVLVCEKWKCHRAIILVQIGIKDSYAEDSYPTESEIKTAMEMLDKIKDTGPMPRIGQ